MTSPPPWSNQPLVLFHGTTLSSAHNIETHGIDVKLGKPDCDFGKGFYCTTSEQQAREWSRIKAARSAQTPAVVSLSVPRSALANLRSLVFVRGDHHATDFWSFVHHCRKLGWPGEAEHTSRYDVTYGPVAIAWLQLKIKPDSDQIGFHTARAQRLLNTETKRSILSA